MFKLSFQNQVMLGFAISLVLIFTSSYLSYDSIKNLSENSKMVAHTQEVLNASNLVLNQLLNAETGQRGFIITGTESYLGPYNSSIISINNSVNHLRELISDNPQQIIRVDSLSIYVSLKMDKLKETIITRREQGFNAAVGIVLTDKGRLHMENARKVISNIQDEENRLLKIREDATNISSTNTIRNIILGAILVFIIILLMFFYITRTFKQQREAEERIRKTNNELEILSEENSNRNWLLAGTANLNEQLRGENEVIELSKRVIVALANYVGAKLGAIYLYDEDNKVLIHTGAYAYKTNVNKIKLGEGLVGQAASELKTVVFNDVPNDYTKIYSSIGETSPKSILITPFLFNNKLRGVIELGFSEKLSEKQQTFMQMVSENIAIAIQSATARERMQKLYEQTQQQAEELENQQEELRQTNEELSNQAQLLQASEEELRVQQEELKQTNSELEEKASLLEEKNNTIEEAREAVVAKAKELELSNKYKSEFLANMSHELRTPLNSILILAKLLNTNKHGHLDEEEVKYASVVYNAGNDLLTLINDILDLSKIESGKLDMNFEPISIKEIAEDMLELFNEVAASKKIIFNVEIDPLLPQKVSTDKIRLEQVIRNLLSNAFKFTPADGSIKLRFAAKEDSRLLIAVEDTGIGIPANKQKVIFEAFQQVDGSTSRKYGGTGLGLSISKELAALLGGEIRLSSIEGQGSKFAIVIPFEFAVSGENPENSFSEKIEHIPISGRTQLFLPDDREGIIKEKDKTLLIVEDDLNFADILKDYAHKKGFKVILLHTGETALECAREFKPDAMILDIMLPGRDGWAVLREIRSDAELKHMPVHIMSATDKNTAEIKKHGVLSFISKPVENEVLEHIFEDLQYRFNPLHNKVLVIEDQKVQSDNLKRTLTEQGFQVDQAFTGKDGLEQLNTNQYDCVILDLKLPDISGLELLDTIKQNEKHQSLPVIINTAMDITPAMQNDMMKYSNATVIKNQKSNDRILDEVKLFMNKIKQDEIKPTVSLLSKKTKQQNTTLEKALKDKKVLLVDDDMRNIFALSSSLQHYDLKIEIAANGLEALEKLDQFDDIDIVLMDIMMPKMDGYEAMRKIREGKKYTSVPIIALTAKAMKNDREKCIEAGASDYIPKPVDLDKLLSLMRVWLSNS
jgi:signal transduction histidine kinase/DNA-binding response OmpR family regulator/CHASE3 domain sensor protein